MKTEKQIRLLSIEHAKELLNECEEYDSITLSSDTYYGKIEETIEKKMKGLTNVSCMPPLSAGKVIIKDYDTPGKQITVIFNVEYLEDYAVVTIANVMEYPDLKSWSGSLKLRVNYTECSIHDIPLNYIAYSDPTLTIYMKQKRTEEELNRYQEKAIVENYDHNPNFFIAEMFLNLMLYINFLQEHPEEKELAAEKRHPARQQKVRESEKRGEKDAENSQSTEISDSDTELRIVKEISLNGIHFKTSNQKLHTALRSRTINRISGSWGVRGHIRHYKNGKTVYIKPYEKGKDRKKRIMKKYNIE